jgi:hypothetical protein
MDQTRHSIFLHLPHPHGELCHRLWIAPSWRFCRPRPRMHAAAGHATARTDGSPKSPTDSSTSHNTIRVVRIVCNTYHTSSIPDFEPKGTLLGPGTSLGMCPIMWNLIQRLLSSRPLARPAPTADDYASEAVDPFAISLKLTNVTHTFTRCVPHHLLIQDI